MTCKGGAAKQQPELMAIWFLARVLLMHAAGFKDAMETYFANRDASEGQQREQQQQLQEGQEDTGAPAVLRTGAQGGL